MKFTKFQERRMGADNLSAVLYKTDDLRLVCFSFLVLL